MRKNNCDWWCMYEYFQDGACIFDTETQKLLYVNPSLRKLYGMEEQRYEGMKYSDVLQGFKVSSVCSHEGHLEYGYFYEKSCYNKVLGQSFLSKDMYFISEGKTLCLEILISLEQKEQGENEKAEFFHPTEYVVNCIKFVHNHATPRESLEGIMKYIVDTFGCESAAVFRSADPYFEWYCEWSEHDEEQTYTTLATQIELWDYLMTHQQGVYIDENSDLYAKFPILREVWKECGIHNAAIEVLRVNGQIIGLVGATNIPDIRLHMFLSFLSSICFFVATLLRSQISIDECERVRRTDALTGAQNHMAFLDEYDSLKEMKQDSLGVVACDVLGLQRRNVIRGSDHGDTYLKKVYQILCKVFKAKEIYRISGDKFVILDKYIHEGILHQKLKRLRAIALKSGIELAVGVSYRKNCNIQEQIQEAINRMYDKKKEICEKQLVFPEEERKARNMFIAKEQVTSEDFLNYIYYGNYKMDFLFRVINAHYVPYAVMIGDLKSDLFYIPKGMRDKFGIQESVICDFVGLWEKRIASEEEREVYLTYVREMLEGKREEFEYHYHVLDRNNQSIWVMSSGKIQKDPESGEPLFYTGLLSWQEHDFILDYVTGFAKDISALETLETIQKEDILHTAIAFTPNNIRELNEARGRNFVDYLLQEITQEISQELGDKLILFRLDGVRFMGLAPFEDPKNDERIVKRIRNIICKSYHEQHISIQEPCTTAVLHYPCNMQAKEFLGAVITSLRMAKNTKEKTSMQESIEDIKECQHKSEISLQLSTSVMQGFEGFRIVVQPIVNADTGRIEKGEVLLRWNNGKENLSPSVFVPILEENDLMIQTGKWVFEQTVSLCRECLVYRPDFHLSFNVSYYQIEDDEFLDFMDRTLKQYNVDGSHLTMELTESHFDEQPERLEVFMEQCRKMGITIALDDFGNGYSSLGLLLKYPVDVLKLDKSILDTMSVSKNSMKFMKSIIYSCHEFGTSVIVEGVETQEQKEIVCACGGDMIQGYYFFKPLEKEELHRALLMEGV